MVNPRDPRRHKRSAPALVPAWMFHQSGVIYAALIETLHTATPGAAVHSKHVRVRRNGSHRSWSATVAMPAMTHFSSPSELDPLTPSTPIVSLPTDSRLCGFALSACKNTRHRPARSEEHTSELQSQSNLVCRLLLAKKT